ncbi:unnamed protein product [Heterobilharzia americana]|nr:unnamed protein product [Heterobilharzia americana]
MTNVCITPSCGKPSTLRCPVCIKLGITTSFFCSQVCNCKLSKRYLFLRNVSNKETYDDDRFIGYKFTGQLRPARKAPDYAVTGRLRLVPHFNPGYTGIPTSERQGKDSHSIQVLDDDEVECMRIAGKLAREVLDEAVNAVDVGVTTDEIDRIVHEVNI